MYVMNSVKTFYDEFNFSNYEDLVEKTEKDVRRRSRPLREIEGESLFPKLFSRCRFD